MPLELEIIRATEFVRMGAQGKFDLAASKSALATLAEACRKRGIDQAVVDLRATQSGPNPVLTPADLAELVRIFPDVGLRSPPASSGDTLPFGSAQAGQALRVSEHAAWVECQRLRRL